MNTHKIEITVEGDPKGQPRPRAFARNGMVRMYDPGTAEGWKAAVAMAVKEAGITTTQFHEGPVSIKMDFRFSRPKSHFNKSGIKCRHLGAPHTQKPDLDNLAKAVMDALTTTRLWYDDAQVWAMTVTKCWCNYQKPGCAITVHNLECREVEVSNG